MIKKIVNYIKSPSLKIIYCQNNVNVINYDKILEIKDDIVLLLVSNKRVIVSGENLRIIKLLDNELLITGIIKKIEM